MKINPVGVQAYQQLARQEQNTAPLHKEKSAEPKDVPLHIAPQEPEAHSALAVKAPGKSYAEFLTPEEKAALDLLFSRFSDNGRFGHALRSSADSDESETIGRIVDVKV